MGSQDIVVNSWRELIDELFKDCWLADIRRFRSTYAYRGLSDKQYDLETSLIRLGGPVDRLERHLLKNFIKYARLENPDNFTECYCPIFL